MRKDEFPLIEAYADSKVNDVLDKIRAEIEFEVDHRTNMLCAEDVFAILDKYKAESGRKTVTEQSIGSLSYSDGTFIISAEEMVESEDKE